MIDKLLIANRGEIARRIGRTCTRLGIPFVAVYSDADRAALHLSGAAQSVRIGPAPAAQSYLDGAALIRAALETGCTAVHPGVGFLAENAAFAAAVEQAGLIFVGPAPDTIAALGDKGRAKALMAAAGVPVVPGAQEASEDPDEVLRLIAGVGLPALLKPAAGGGGKGMTVVTRSDAREEIESAVRTARAAFGDGRLLVERLIERPRHVEVQVFGDGKGEAVHLFDRECSLQRRHQKVVEEAPAATLSDALRAQLAEAAVNGARAIRYRNAGTFEFIVGPDGAFYYLEVNTRLQVEHPVTEAITGLDLVEWQLRIASGAPLPLAQEDIRAEGHAIECRLYAEDPAAGFRPSPGRITAVAWPESARVESAVAAGSHVPPHYDPMIAKVIVRADDRAAALDAMRKALAQTTVMGVATNLGFLARLLARPEVMSSDVHTRLIDELLPELLPSGNGREIAAIATAAVVLAAVPGEGTKPSPWHAGASLFGRREISGDARLGDLVFDRQGTRWHAAIRALAGTEFVVEIREAGEGATYVIQGRRTGDGLVAGLSGGRPWQARLAPDAVEVVFEGGRAELSRAAHVPEDEADATDWASAEMPGVMVALKVEVGTRVNRGDTLAVIEAMKFENPVVASRNGTVAQVECRVGQQVELGQKLVRLSA